MAALSEVVEFPYILLDAEDSYINAYGPDDYADAIAEAKTYASNPRGSRTVTIYKAVAHVRKTPPTPPIEVIE